MTTTSSHRRKTTKASHRSDSLPDSPMASSSPPSPTSPSSPYKWVLRVGAIAVLVTVIGLFGISSNSWSALLQNDPLKTHLPKVYTVEIVNEFPHDPNAFTQGLVYWRNDTLYESTGLYGHSTVRQVALQTGKVETQHKLDSSFFGEGLTVFGDRLYQVTWLRQTGFIYERNDLSNPTSFTHHMKDGWGLATDGKNLFGSDGSSTLYQIDPQTMEVTHKQTVRYEGLEVPYLNELEFINGEVWANVFGSDCIVKLSPDGTVIGWILLHNLREELIQAGEKVDVLNGIAWDSNTQRIFVTGKLWPKLYEIKLHAVREHSYVDVRQLCHLSEQFQF